MEKNGLSRKEKESNSKKAHILNCLLNLTIDNDLDSITVKDIADEAEYSKGNLYIYFKNRDEILLALQYISLRLWQDIQDWCVGSQDHGLDKLRAIGEARRILLADFTEYYDCNYLSDHISYSNFKDSSYLKSMELVNESTNSQFRQLIIDSVESKQIRNMTSPDMLICLLESFSEGIFATIRKSKNAPRPFCNPDRLHDEYMGFIGSTLETENKIPTQFNKERFREEMLNKFKMSNIDIINKYI